MRRGPPTPGPRPAPLPWRRNLVLSLTAATVFVAISLWCVRPLLPRWHEAYAGGGELEGWLWRYWWMKGLILDAFHYGTCRMAVFVALVSGSYPETGNVFDLQLFSMPLEALFGSPDSYNYKVVLVLTLNGLTGYWLARLLVEDWAAAVLCGFTFAFGAYVLLEIDTGRMRQAVIFPLALLAFALMKMTLPAARIRYAIYGGLAFGLCSSVFLFYGMSAAFMSLLWLVWLASPSGAEPQAAVGERRAVVRARVVYVLLLAVMACGFGQLMVAHVPPAGVRAAFLALLALLVAWLVRRDGWVRLRQLAVFGLIAILSSLPYATWYVQQAFVKHQPLPEVSINRPFPSLQTLEDPLNVHSSDDALLNSMQRFRGDSVSWDFPFLADYRRSAPLVLTMLAVGGLLLFPRRPWLFVGVMLLGYVLGLGPYLKAGSNEEYLARPDGIRLPQAWFFEYVPAFSRLFSPIRMQGLFLVGFGVVVAWSTTMLFRRLNIGTPLRVAFAGVIIILSLRQMGAGTIPLRYTPVQVPDVYNWIAGADTDGIVEIPLREGDYVNYYQIYHGKRVLDGWASRSIPDGYPESRTRWLAEVPLHFNVENSFLRWLRAANEGEGMSVTSFVPGDLKQITEGGYRYALLHERGCYIVKGPDGHEQYIFMRKLLDRILGKPVRATTERVREHWTDSLEPDADGLYGYEIVVYDLKKAKL